MDGVLQLKSPLRVPQTQLSGPPKD